MSKLQKRSFATLSTVSPAGFPHAAGVVYELVGEHLYINTLRTSRKARNVASSGRGAISVPVRRVPVGGPPSTIQFQATAELVDVDDPSIASLIEQGHLKALTSHGELELPGSVFVRIALPRTIHTHGLGMSLRALIADPISASGVVHR